jgi:hypothetical protein
MLFDQGLADPRGCEYRAIRIAVGNDWGGAAQEVDVDGWVIPPADGGRPRHAIAWNGLVYPLISAGDPADLAFGFRNLAAADESPDAGRRSAVGEAAAVAVGSFHPIKICLLLRLGRADLAEGRWSAGIGPLPKAGASKPRLDLNSYGVSYLTLASDFAWFHFDRAARAHQQGDDALALADARAIEAMRKGVQAAAERMGFDRPARYLEFLNQAPALLADQERRARERSAPPAPAQGEGAADRVSALIRKLDQAAPLVWMNPGGIQWGSSPSVEELIAEGDAAVEPLIRCLRSDERLTRSVSFGRGFGRRRWISPVYEPAYAALMGILKTRRFGEVPRQGEADEAQKRKELADRIQAYWDKNRSIPRVERWYRTLADDEAGVGLWLEAAGLIVQLESVEKPRLRGEPLRDGRSPSVEELMKRRGESMRATADAPGRASDAMAKLLETWLDPKAAARAAAPR